MLDDTEAMNTDVVIPFVAGPRNSIELKFALRSIEKNLDAPNKRVWIYGEKPDWLTNVEFYPMKRTPKPKFVKFFDQLKKIELASRNDGIGLNFIYTYDDVYFMKPVTMDCLKQPRALMDMGKIPFGQWFKGTDAGPNWVECMKMTLYRLKKENLPLFNYETHLPRVYNKVKALAVLDKYNSHEFAFQFATMYFNNYETRPELLSENRWFRLGIYHPIGYRELVDRANRSAIMNVSKAYDDSINVLESFFPDKSRYEK